MYLYEIQPRKGLNSAIFLGLVNSFRREAESPMQAVWSGSAADVPTSIVVAHFLVTFERQLGNVTSVNSKSPLHRTASSSNEKCCRNFMLPLST